MITRGNGSYFPTFVGGEIANCISFIEVRVVWDYVRQRHFLKAVPRPKTVIITTLKPEAPKGNEAALRKP